MTQARSLLAATTVALVSGLTLSACGNGDVGGDAGAEASGDVDPTTTASPEESTTAPPSPEELAIAAYQAGWVAEFEALNPPNPQHPDLAEVFTGEAAQSVVAIVAEEQNAGRYTVGSMETQPEAVSVTGSEVLLRDCTVEDSTTYDAATGAVVETGPYPPRSRHVEVVNQEGTWRVSVIRTLEEPCVRASG